MPQITALQELIQYLDKVFTQSKEMAAYFEKEKLEMSQYTSVAMSTAYSIVKAEATELLNKERQDLIIAHHDGQLDGSIKTPSLKAAEEYFNEIFKQ